MRDGGGGSRVPLAGLVGLLALACAACIDVSGGAVELAWEIRTLDGTSVNCDDPLAQLETVAVCVRACDTMSAGSCVGVATCPTALACDRESGSTEFNLPPGPTEIWIEPRCLGGGAAKVSVPPPVVRDILEGRVAQLGALLITLPETGAACP